MFESVKNWPFLQEPLYRWVVFIIALSFILGAWNSMLNYIREAG